MCGATFQNLKDDIQAKADKISATFTIENEEIEVTQGGPWNVTIILKSDITLADKSGLVSWSKKAFEVIGYVNIIGLVDPTYPLELGAADVKIAESKFNEQGFESDADLIEHAENTYYLFSAEAPSFIDRLQGDITVASPYGIESLVAPKISPISGLSIVDHEYYQGTTGSLPIGLPIYLRIDAEHWNTLYDPDITGAPGDDEPIEGVTA